MASQVCIVTGATNGIGRAIAHQLAAKGHEVHIAARNLAKAQGVSDAIRAAVPDAQLHILPLDLASLASVRQGAAQFLGQGRPLHVLVNNAGVGGTSGHTEDGFELAFGVNHLGHFLFTQLLLPCLRASGPARLVNVTSNNHFKAPGIDFEAVREPTASFTGLREYAVSKLANVVFTAEMSRRVSAEEVAAVAVHPGRVASGIWDRIPWPVRPLFTRGMLTNEQGAAPVVDLATRAEVPHGGYFDGASPRDPHPLAHDAELGRSLWEASERWAGLAG